MVVLTGGWKNYLVFFCVNGLVVQIVLLNSELVAPTCIKSACFILCKNGLYHSPSGGGGFFLACENFQRMFDYSHCPPVLFFFFLKWRLAHTHEFHSLGQDQSTVD